MNKSKIIVALDFPSEKAARDCAAQLDPELCRIKIGKELFTRVGPGIVRTLIADGFDIFLDLKFHDIPNTVAGACSAAADLGCWMINVHASGGRQMMMAAREAVNRVRPQTHLIAVTVLTSLDEEQTREIGFNRTPSELVENLAGLALDSGMDGVVCSAQEAEKLRTLSGPDFLLVTPGIRPAGGDAGDQKRVSTPAAAINAGASYLVIGRPITQAPDPVLALQEITAQIETAV